MERYIAQKNIKHFTELLGTKLDPTLRKMLVRLLSIEKAKLMVLLEAARSQALDADAHHRQCVG